MAEKNHFEGDSYLTKKQVEIYKKINQTENIKQLARKMEITENSLYVLRRNVHRIIERCLRTLKIAKKLQILDLKKVKEICEEK